MTQSPSQFRAELLAVTPQLRAYARALSRAADKADDLVQDTLLRAWEKQNTLRDIKLLKPWLMAIMRNLFRLQQRHARFTIEDIDDTFAGSVAVNGDQETNLELHDVNQALSAMSNDQREAIVLIFVHELSYGEAAELAGCAIGTMKSRVNRARRHLTEQLGLGKPTQIDHSAHTVPCDEQLPMQFDNIVAQAFDFGVQPVISPH